MLRSFLILVQAFIESLLCFLGRFSALIATAILDTWEVEPTSSISRPFTRQESPPGLNPLAQWHVSRHDKVSGFLTGISRIPSWFVQQSQRPSFAKYDDLKPVGFGGIDIGECQAFTGGMAVAA